MASFSTTANFDEPIVARVTEYAGRLRRARLGLFVALIPVLMLFVSFTSAYVVRQGLPTLDPRTNQLVRDWISVKLPQLLLLNTLVLVLSSGGMELARRQAKFQVANPSGPGSSRTAPARIPWLGFTMALGLLFLVGQWMAWRQLAANGFYVSTTPSSSFVYLLTGAHAVHLLGGLLALLVAGLLTLLERPVALRNIVVDVTAWYWHFMAALWIYILCLLEFAK